MKRGDSIKVLLVFFISFVAVFLYDNNHSYIEAGSITRSTQMDEEKEIALILEAEGLPENYVYKIQVKGISYTKEEAEQFFQEAKAEIEDDFAEISSVILAKESYASGKVEAAWLFSPRDVIDTEYHIKQEEISENGEIVHAAVTLTCGAYEEIYTFAFRVEKQLLTEEEQLLSSLDNWFEKEMEKEGEANVLLPEEINGVTLHWSEKEQYLPFKVLCLEMVVFCLLYFQKKEEKKEKERLRLKHMEQEYPEIIGSLSVLLGAGMTLKQAWKVMTGQYVRQLENGEKKQKAAWEEVVLVNRKIQEGESEKEALLQMIERVPLMCYHRCIHMLLANKEKGTKGLCELLDKEAETAYEQQILNIRKLGEEASAKLLFPMMIMLILVMGIVLLPAFINFSM